MIQTSDFDRVLESVESLPIEDQEALLDLVKKRLAERRREEIATNIVQAKEEYRTGQVFRSTFDG